MKFKEAGRQASAWTKFSLLMWKNFLQQWRHKVQTFAEILLPLFTMSLILILRSQIEPSMQDVRTYPPIRASSIMYSQLVIGGMDFSKLSFAYSPRSELLDDVVRSALAHMIVDNGDELIPELIENPPADFNITIPPNLNLSSIYGLIKAAIPLDAYDSSELLKGIYIEEERTKQVFAAIQFPDEMFGQSVLPNNMTYELRFPEIPRLNSFYGVGGSSWRTENTFPVFEIPGPRFPNSWEGGNNPGYVNEMFIALQQVISTELISRMAGFSGQSTEVHRFKVNIQRYPYPSYLQDNAITTLTMLFPMFITLSFSYTAVNIVRAVVVEKEMQLKETMKIMGLPTWLHWAAWFCKQFIYLVIIATFVIILLKVSWFTTDEGFNDYAVFTNTPWTVIFFFLLLYLACTILFCFMVSGIFSKASTAAVFTGVIWFLTYFPAVINTLDVEMSASVQAVTCLCINSAMAYGFQLMISRETVGGIQWGDFFATPSPDSSRFVFGHVVLMLVFDCILYLLLALYLEQVRPGPFGAPKPWYFIFQTSFWCPRSKINSSLNGAVLNVPNEDDGITKEKDPTGLTVGVSISNLTKVYGSNTAVNNLSMNIYDDQITVLLGHNGAGKSTTISMITGNLEASRGKVLVSGYDVAQQTSAARAHLGLCPQHDVLFAELTVREHLLFFASLKGYYGKELREEVDVLINKLELNEKREYAAGGLSGGQRRRLCVGVALSGGARVVLLDEPTSGMDPAARRALWDLLQNEKKDRTVILTTHFMDEADVLGDRVAIMRDGRLQCVGSPYFLKRHYGVGYTLVVVKQPDFNYDKCTQLINKYIPDVNVKEDRGLEITYILNKEFSHVFEDMLNELEENMETIRFKNYGLTCTTLEDVFMSVGSELKSGAGTEADAESEADGDSSTVTDADETLKYDSLEQLSEDEDMVSGWRLHWQHARAIWLKLFLVRLRSPLLTLLQLFSPVVIVSITFGVLLYMLSFVPNIRGRHLTLTEGYSDTETLLHYNGTSDGSLGYLVYRAYENMYLESPVSTMGIKLVDEPIDDYYLEQASDASVMSSMRHRVLAGATLAADGGTAWFSNFGYHDLPTSLANLHSAILKTYNPEADIRVVNHPLEAAYNDRTDTQLLTSMLTMQLGIGIGNSLGIVSAFYIMFYIKERVSRAKLLQRAAGVDPAVLWGAAAGFDWLWFALISVLVILTCYLFNFTGLSNVHELGRVYLCIIVYGAATLPMHYLFSHVFTGPALGFVVMFFINQIVGMLGAMIVEALSSPILDTAEAANILDSVLQFFPLYSLISAVRELTKVDLLEFTCMQTCEQLLGVMSNITECTMPIMCQMQSFCCVRENPYLEWEAPGVLRYVVCMLVSCSIFWLALLLVEYRPFDNWWVRSRSPAAGEGAPDGDVADETEHARAAPTTPPAAPPLVARALAKYYGNNLAVDQISFTVAEGEIFGLLGVNGAGKTTTFKMLMGDESISSGDAYVCGYSVKTDLNKVHENIGYCPQYDAVFVELTGRENLQVFAMLRGYGPRARAALPLALALRLGFGAHLHKPVSAYSGGNKRKLTTAIALLGRTRLVFVDEPTTGVDPAAKRRVWRALRLARRAGRALLLTSHSMEECEALCSRLTIMVNGWFHCLGTPQHLKNKFSEGFTLTIKMKMDEDTSADSEASINLVKNYVTTNFHNPRLMEEYQGLMTYYLPDRRVPWSRMFGLMERAKHHLALDDYSISQTTLEQIFLQFTKYQR